MKTKFIMLSIFLLFSSLINAAHTGTPNDIEAGEQRSGINNRQPVETTPLLEARAINLFRADYENNVKDLICSRWFFRKVANCSEAFGNTLLYLSAGAPAIAAALQPIYPTASPYITATGLMCLGAHVIFIGVAKCSAREEGERENQLTTLAQQVGFNVVPLKPQITDDAGGEAKN